MAFAYLLDPEKQYITKSGTINVGGVLRVYDAATDDAVVTYRDFNGTENEEAIILDNNGRAVVIADSERAYRLEVYDRYGTLQWTTTPLWCIAAGGGIDVHDTEVISTNGSIDVSKTVVGSTTTFDIGLAPSSTEFLEWCKCLNLSISNGLVSPVFYEGTMTTDEGGLHVYKDRYYHVTCTLRVDPTGSGINYDTLSVNLKFSDGNEVDLVRRNYDIDNSVNDPTLCEFSYDFNSPGDGYLYLYVEGVSSFEQVDVALQVHRVYSGINAVPDTCATQQWVRGYFDFNMSAHIPYSALEYDSNNEISGISGSAIAGNINSAQVSAIASSYAESAVSSMSGLVSSKLDASASSEFYSTSNPSGFVSNADLSSYAKESSLSSKLDASASSMFAPSGDYAYNSALSSYIPESASGQFAPSGDYADASSVSSKVDQSAFDACCSAMSAAVSAKLDASASSDFVLNSSFSSYSSDVANSITSISSVMSSKADSSALSSYQPVSAMSSYATESYVDSALSSKLDVTASSQFLTSLPEDLAYTSDVASAVSSKMDKSESSSFYPMDSNPAGYLTAHQSLAGYATVEYVDSAVSAKLDASAYDSAWFQPASSMSSWIPYSALDYSGTAISGIGGSSLAGMGGGGGGDYSGVAPVNVDNDSRLISVDHRTLCVDETLSAYNSGSSAVIGVNTSTVLSGLSGYQLTADMTAYQLTANMTGYIPVSALGTGEI